MSDSRELERELEQEKDMLRQRASDVVHWATQIKNDTNAGTLNNCLSSIRSRTDDLEHYVRRVISLESDLKRAKDEEEREKEKARREQSKKNMLDSRAGHI